MCRIASIFLLQRLKGSMSGDVGDFNNIETRALVFFFPAKQGAKGNHAILTETLGNMHHHTPPSKTGWPNLNVVIFPRVMRLVLDDTKQ